MVRIAALLLGLFFGLGVGLDAFQTTVLPRRPSGRWRITRLFFIVTWNPWSAIARRLKEKNVREEFYSVYGPISLILLLIIWAVLLVATFALVFFAMGSPFRETFSRPDTTAWSEFLSDLYVSGTTLFTLGLGDVVPKLPLARGLIIVEAGVGLGFVAMVIGYLPVLYGAFSRREVSIALLDARAGSPPTAGELLRRHGFDGGEQEMIALLAEWERWSAELLESHISYPVLCYYRSQHDNQSWLSALTAILDTCSLLITSVEETPVRQAQLTFAMARHALVDLALVFKLKSQKCWSLPKPDRLPSSDFRRLCGLLSDTEIQLCGDPASEERLKTIRALYEPYAQSLAYYLGMPVSNWVAEPKKTDQWGMVASLRTRPPAARKAGEVVVGTPVRDLHIDHAASTRLHDEEHRF